MSADPIAVAVQIKDKEDPDKGISDDKGLDFIIPEFSNEMFLSSDLSVKNEANGGNKGNEVSDTTSLKKHECAVSIKNVNHHYGKFHALKNINSRISRGEIYGLLGPSGCGKSTLLKCIVGIIRPKTGEITVFGVKPGSRKSFIPGPAVGYMPQEIALYNELTIQENIDYYGRIYGMSKSMRKKRVEFLLKFLDLPEATRLVVNLSGGQQRRASLAVALVHNPPLLILDEPTVGVDPLLREAIWNHLVELTKTENMTIIITTHYIEEARQAYQIGLMRLGQLLVEDKPANLLAKYSVNSLEAVFLKVCLLSKESPHLFDEQKQISDNTEQEMAHIELVTPNFCVKHINKISAMIIKGVKRLRRNKTMLLIQTLLPAMQVILFCLSIGGDPHDLNVAVYNPDDNYSHRFLSELSSETFNFIDHPNVESAVKAVRDGNSWVAMTFHENYTNYVKKRLSIFAILTPDDLTNSKVQLYTDSTNYPIHALVMAQLVNGSLNFVRKLIAEIPVQLPNVTNAQANLDVNKQSVTDPYYEIKPPIYGSIQPSFRNFAVPGMLLAVILALAVGLTALAFVIDRKGGQLERTLIAGAHPIHVLIGHFIIQVSIIFLQTLVLLFCVFVLCDIELKGNIFLVIVLVMLQGMIGMSFGLLISSFCHDEIQAVFLAQGSFYPNLILSGIFWPVEGMPIVLQYISYVMPQTLPIRALRAIVSRGWGLMYTDVWLGFVVSFIWIGFFNFIAIVILIYTN